MSLVVLLIMIVVYVGLVWMLDKKRQYKLARPLELRNPTNSAVPDHFDWRERGMQFPVFNSGSCGDCYIIAALIPFQLRNKLPPLSTSYPLRCQAYCSQALCDEGCGGGLVDHTWQFLLEHGVPPASADAVDCDSQPQQFRAREIYKLPADTNAIKSEIFQNGPVSAGMTAYKDFASFTGTGVYKYDGSSDVLGGHAVVLLGWGPGYWIGLNSWGSGWGDGGFFKIPFTDCDIQDDVVAGR